MKFLAKNLNKQCIFTYNWIYMCMYIHTHTHISVFYNRVSLCISCFPGTFFADQAGHKLKNSPASASHLLEVKACTTVSSCKQYNLNLNTATI